MGSLFGNYLGMSLESFIGLPFYFYFVSLIEVLFESDSWYNVLQLILEIPHGSNVWYSDLVRSPLRATLVVPPSVSSLKFLPPPSWMCLNYPSRSTFAVTLSWGHPTLPWWHGLSCHWRKSKGNNKVDNELEGLVGLVVFVASNL